MASPGRHRQAQPLRLSIPPHPPLSSLPTSSSTPTPSKRRPSTAATSSAVAAVLLRFLSLYSLFLVASSAGTVQPFPAALLSSLLLLLFPSPSPPAFAAADLKPLLLKSFFLAASLFLRFSGLLHCSAGGVILAEFCAVLIFRFSARLRSRSGISGGAAVALSLLLLAFGYDQPRCSGCGRPGFAILLPFAAGVCSVIEKDMVPSALARRVGRPRLRSYSLAIAAILLAVPSLFDSYWQGKGIGFMLGLSSRGMALAALISVAVFGIALGESSARDERSAFAFRREFVVMFSSTLALQLVYVPKLSLPGFMLCGMLVWIAVVLLAPSPSSYVELGDLDGSESLYAAIMGPVRHILSERKSRKIAAFLFINTMYMVVEFSSGFMSNSLGLISDACHMLFDCAALAIGLYASYISRLPANGKYNYGRGRFEVVSGYVNAVFLVLVGALIVLESIERILDPREISTDSLLAVSIGGLVVNVIGLIFFHEEHHHAHGGGSCTHSHSSSGSHSIEHDHRHSHSGGTCTHSNSSSHSHSSVPAHDHSHHHDHNHQHKCSHENSCLELEGQHDSHTHGCSHSYSNSHSHSSVHAHDHSHQNSCQGQEGQHNGHTHDYFDGHVHNNNYHQHGHQGGHPVWREHVNAPVFSNGEVEDFPKHGHDHVDLHRHGKDTNCDHSDHEKLLKSTRSPHDEHHSGPGLCDHQSHRHSSVTLVESSRKKLETRHHVDHNMEGIFLHVLADTMGSVGVVASTLLIKYKGWLVADPICSVFISVMIVTSVLPLLRNSAEILLQRVPRTHEKDVKLAVDDLTQIRGVCSVEDVHLWSLTQTESVGTFHICISEEADKASVLERASEVLRDAGVTDLTIQVERAPR